MRTLICCIAAFLTSAATIAEDAPDLADLPERLINFRLIDAEGKSHELYRYRDAKAIVLYYQGNGCPIVRQSFRELMRLRDAYREDGVVFLQINANPQDTREEVLEEMADFEVDIPVLMDERQGVTRMLGVNRTAEAILINPQRWRIVYRGAVDDRFDYGTRRPEAQNEYLKDAIEAFLAGEEPNPARTEAKGCLIHLMSDLEQISYRHDVAPILADKCVTCHAPGQVGPFAFASHRDVFGWSRMIEEVVLTQRMPPWNADPHVGTFGNDWSLTLEEERTLLAWLAQGAPMDEGPDPLVAAAAAHAVDTKGDTAPQWALGEPDMVISLPRPAMIPAEGVVPYKYFHLPMELDEDVWVTAAEVLPTDLSVTHHALIFVVYPDHYQHLWHDIRAGLDGYFAAYVPGQAVLPFPEGTAKFLPKGSTLVFQMHYTPNGRETTDHTRLGLHLQTALPERVYESRAASNTRLSIPPGEYEVPTRATYRFEDDVILYGMSPHMHYRGKWFRYEAVLPDGERRPLLSVPHYDFNWQMMYRLEEPMALPAGTRIVCTGAHDNSAGNPANPNPNVAVRFGEQSDAEMFVGYIEYTKLNESAAEWLASGKK